MRDEELPRRRVSHLRERVRELFGFPGAAFVEEATPRPGEPEVVKYRVSPMPDSRLELLLRSNRIRSVIVAGTPTYGSVESTVRDVSNKDFFAVVPADCVAAPAEKKHLHEAALETMGVGFGIVTTSTEIKRAWGSRGQPRALRS